MKDNLLSFTKGLDIMDDKEDLPEIEIEEIEINFNDDIGDDIIEDYRYTRKKLINMIQSAEGVLKHALTDMKNNPGPRPVEAFSSLLKTMNETHKEIFSLHEKMKKINQKPKEQEVEDGKPKKLTATVNDIIDAMSGGE